MFEGTPWSTYWLGVFFFVVVYAAFVLYRFYPGRVAWLKARISGAPTAAQASSVGAAFIGRGAGNPIAAVRGACPHCGHCSAEHHDLARLPVSKTLPEVAEVETEEIYEIDLDTRDEEPTASVSLEKIQGMLDDVAANHVSGEPVSTADLADYLADDDFFSDGDFGLDASASATTSTTVLA